jgi:AraC family transcriptional regulator of arabinose operon
MQKIRYFLAPALAGPGFAIRGLGIQERMRPCIVNRPRGTGDFLVVVFYDPVDIRTSATVRRWPAGHLVVWQPGDAHYFGNPAGGWNHSWIHCQGRLVKDRCRAERLPFGVPIALQNPSLVDRYILAIHEEIGRHAKPHLLILRNHLVNLLCEIGRLSRGEDREPLASRRLTAMRAWLEAHYREPVALRDAAAQANLSPAYACSQFNRAFGFSPMDYVIRLRLREAVHLLHDCSLSVKEVARAVGFQDLSYFSRFFRRHFGLSPRQARERIASAPLDVAEPP